MDSIIDSEGKRRKAAWLTCSCCMKEFLARIRDKTHKYPYRYCSRDCHVKHRASILRVDIKCSFCLKPFSITKKRQEKSRSGFCFCSTECKHSAQRIDSGFTSMLPKFYGDVPNFSTYRKLVDKDACSVCGITDSWKIVVHHIDGNRKNASKENLEVVCTNCHCNRHAEEIKGVLHHKTTCLSSRDLVKELDALVRPY